MKNNRLLLIIFISLGTAAGFLFYHQQSDNTLSTLVADRAFAPQQIEEVNRVFIADRQGNTSDLVRHANQWTINGKYRVRENAMDNLLDAIERIKVKYKPADAAVPTMVKNLASEGIKVELYDNNNRLLKAYYIGGSTQDERGTYAIMAGAEQPYVTHLPGWDGNLRFRFNLTGDDWRDKALFRFKPTTITKVSIEYPRQKSKSFRLFKKGLTYEVEPFYEATPRYAGAPAPGRTEAFLMGFEEIIAEAFENDNPVRDSITQLLPFSIIKISTTQNEVHKVALFPVIPRAVTINPDTGLPLASQPVERYFAEVNDEDFMLAQNQLVRRILWSYDFFFEENTQSQ